MMIIENRIHYNMKELGKKYFCKKEYFDGVLFILFKIVLF